MRPVSPPSLFLRLATPPALLTLGLTILAPLSAAAQDTSRITRVTVYPGSATGRSSQSFSAVGSSPCGHSCTSLATPCWASAITSSSRNAP